MELENVMSRLQRMQRSSAVMVLVGLISMAPLFWVVLQSQSRLDRLERDGVSVPGEVVEARDSRRFEYVEVEFVYEGTQRRERISNIDNYEYLEVGQPVTVLVDPTDPSVVTLPGETNESTIAMLIAATIFVCGLLAVWFGGKGLRSARRASRVLREVNWQPAHIRFLHMNAMHTAMHAQLDTGDGERDVRITGVMKRWPLPDHTLGGAWEAGSVKVSVRGNVFVATLDGHDPLVGTFKKP